jgi:peptide deformylase
MNFDGELEVLVQDMFDTMYDAGGVGLAAQQIGVSLRLFVMDCDGLKLVAANPEVISVEGEQSGEEGCLSVGKVPADLKRPDRAVLRAQDLMGKTFEREASGLAARCFLHETDHCDGILFIRHLSPLRRDLVTRKFRKMKNER